MSFDGLPGYDAWKTTPPEDSPYPDDYDPVQAREDAILDRAGL
jgi:hypothetical protein